MDTPKLQKFKKRRIHKTEFKIGFQKAKVCLESILVVFLESFVQNIIVTILIIKI